MQSGGGEARPGCWRLAAARRPGDPARDQLSVLQVGAAEAAAQRAYFAAGNEQAEEDRQGRPRGDYGDRLPRGQSGGARRASGSTQGTQAPPSPGTTMVNKRSRTMGLSLRAIFAHGSFRGAATRCVRRLGGRSAQDSTVSAVMTVSNFTSRGRSRWSGGRRWPRCR